MTWWQNMPYFYPEHVSIPSGSYDSGLLETPTETATSSAASCIGVDDVSDPGTAMTETDGALEDRNQLSARPCTQAQARVLPREQHSSLRPTIYSRRWKDEEDEEAEEGEEEDRDDREAEAIGKLLKAVRKLSRPKDCEL
jgi:hypothetical protein